MLRSILNKLVIQDGNSIGFTLSINDRHQLSTDSSLDEILIVLKILVGDLNFFLGQKILEFMQHVVRGGEILGNGFVNGQVMFAKIKKHGALGQQFLSGC